MIRLLRTILALTLLVALASCGAPKSKFKGYDGPPVTQIVVNKGERTMHLLSGRTVLKSYKLFEGDGRTPEGMYFISHQNPNSRYHLSLGISYPDAEDHARAMMLGQQPGGDIMIHGRGAYGAQQRNRDWTAGCIAVSDEEIEEIFAMVRPGVPIVIYP